MDRVLVIDDDIELCELVAEYLKQEGFEVEAVHDGAQGIEQALSGDYALVVLDVMLPGVNGFDVLRRVRAKSRTPVLMLTARGEEVDRIVGLEIGADDYLSKPFNPRELVARIRAILRRTKSAPPETPGKLEVLSVGDIELDKGARVVRRAGKPVELTAVEFDLLEILLRSAGHVVTREELFKSVLGREFTPFDRSIDMHVSNLRKKLGHRINGTERIKTIRAVGYIYAHPSAPSRE
jgi:two-component system response regulator CpxR